MALDIPLRKKHNLTADDFVPKQAVMVKQGRKGTWRTNPGVVQSPENLLGADAFPGEVPVVVRGRLIWADPSQLEPITWTTTPAN